ncbi:MAG: zinc-binding dehydrogenase [Pseudomonadota bacterium]
MAKTMHGLVCLNDGYSGSMDGPYVDDLAPYLEHREVDIPEPGDGEVLIRVIMASVNPSDIHFIKGEYGVPRHAGVPAGFEACGEVVASGKGGEGIVGKRVAFFASRSGVWAEYAIANAMTCIPVRDDVRDEDAAAMLVNPMTAIGMYDEATAKSDAFIMTAAASQLCKLIAGLAKEDKSQAIAIVRRDEQIDHLKELGAAHVLNYKSDEFSKELGDLTKKHKPRVLLDAVADQMSAEIFFSMPKHARWIIYGKLSPELPKLNEMGQLIFMNKRIEGFWLTQWMKEKPVNEQIAAAIRVQEMFASGKWQTDIADKIPLSKVHDRLPALLSKMNAGKVLITP